MWYWPVTTEVTPPEWDNWLTVFEGLLGVEGKATTGERFHELAEEFDQLAEIDALEREFFFMKDVTELVVEHPWLGLAREIAQREGFFHWELDLAQVFARGGFDLQVGNPPWVRLDWSDNIALAEHDAYFMLTDKIPEKGFRVRRSSVLESSVAEAAYLRDLESWAGTVEHLGSSVGHPVLAGLRSNLYMNFMERTWRSMGPRGIVGLLHPESHLTDPKAGVLREQTYRRLRRHWQFINSLLIFEDVDDHTVFGVQIYGSPRTIRFENATNLKIVGTIEESFDADPLAQVPTIQYPWGGWDHRPHRSRIMTITEETLAQWAGLFDPPGTPSAQARMVRPLTEHQLDALGTLARVQRRIADTKYWWTSGWNETGAKQDGIIEWRTEIPDAWDEVVMQGPHFTVATPFAKQPNENCKHNQDYSDWDAEALPESVIPRTNYQRACDRGRYDAGRTHWDGLPYTDRWRLAWRRMTAQGLERSLVSTVIPPGPAHVNTVHSMAMATARDTVLTQGLWASLVYDFMVKIAGRADVQTEFALTFPAAIDHPATPYLLLRTLRLNCLTRDYAPLWEGLFEQGFTEDAWTTPFEGVTTSETHPSDGLGDVRPTWDMSAPLRSDHGRRAALVEIDALAAIMLGLTADQLALMYRAQFPVLRKYEYQMFFDADGRKICGHHQSAGVRQGKDDYKIVKAWVEATEDGREPEVELPELYRPPFVRPDREAEMRAAHAEFTARLAGASTSSTSKQVGPSGGAGE
jgi:hypothetical protein